MRLRVLVPLCVFGLLAVAAILIPVGDSIAQSRTQQIQLQRAGSVDQIVQRAYAAVAQGDAGALHRYLERFYDTYGEAVLVVDGAGDAVAGIGDFELDDDASSVVLAALRGVPQWTLPTVYPWSGETEVVAEPITIDGSAPEGAVALRIDQAAAKADVLSGWATVGAIGVALLAALLVASVYWTRWVVRPVLALDAATIALAEHRAFEPADATGPPELRRLAHSFERMARSVEHALEQQRGLVADASHQLRNPLAAIRLRIDALPRGGTRSAVVSPSSPEQAPHGPGPSDPVPIDPSDLDAIGHDLDRLEHMVDRMLVLANAEHRATEAAATAPSTGAIRMRAAMSDADACVVSAVSLIAPHRSSLVEAGIEVEASGTEEHLAFRRGDLEEIVEIVVDNTRKYAPDTTLRISLAVADGRARLVMSDSGAGLAEDDLSRIGTRFWRAAIHAGQPGTGLGYAIVAELARANGATLEVDGAPEGGLRTTVEMRTA